MIGGLGAETDPACARLRHKPEAVVEQIRADVPALPLWVHSQTVKMRPAFVAGEAEIAYRGIPVPHAAHALIVGMEKGFVECDIGLKDVVPQLCRAVPPQP